MKKIKINLFCYNKLNLIKFKKQIRFFKKLLNKKIKKYNQLRNRVDLKLIILKGIRRKCFNRHNNIYRN